MKKTLLTALLLLASVSTFAEQNEMRSADNNEIGLYLSTYLPAGSSVGSCMITRSEPSEKLGSKGYLLEVNTGMSTISLVVSHGGQISTTESETSGAVIVEASSDVTKKGLRTIQALNLKATATEKDDGTEEKKLELSIVTKSQKTRGFLKTSKNNAIDCGSSIAIN